jgi:hypothetical protein
MLQSAGQGLRPFLELARLVERESVLFIDRVSAGPPTLGRT